MPNSSNLTRCLGLIGGLGVGATIHYYRELAKAHEIHGSKLQLMTVHADIERVLKHADAGESNQLAKYLAELIGRMQAGGAHIAAISAVTPHLCVNDLLAISPLPLVNLLDAVNDEIHARRIRRVAVFGTRFTVDSNLFGQLPKLEFVKPHRHEVDHIHNAYLKLARDAENSQESFQVLTELAQKLCKRETVDAIILAGTDLSVIFNEANTDFPHVDCAGVHIASIVRHLRAKT